MSDRPIRVLELRSVRGTGGGPEKTILLGAARSDPRQFEITVCYLRDSRDPIFAVDDRAKALGVDYVEIPERHSFDTGIWPKLRRLVHERHIQIVHSHEYKTDLLAWLLGRAERIVPLATVHGWTGHTFRERRAYYPVDKRLLARFPRLVAVSSEIRRELERYGANPSVVTVLLNAIDPEAFRRDRAREESIRQELGIAHDHVVLGSVGRLEPQKRFDLLIECFAALYREHDNLRLLIVGDGSQKDALATLADRLGVAGRCHLLGARADIASLHHAFDLFVQSSDYEGTPNAVLEAMALETPIVATDVGGTGEIVRQDVDGLLVPAGDVTALSRAVRCTIDDVNGTTRRVVSARARVENELSFSTRVKALENVYVELAGGLARRERFPVP